MPSNVQPAFTETDRLACWHDAPTRYDQTARKLVDMGYPPVPLHPGTKIPTRKGWQHRSSWPLDVLRYQVALELGWRGEADRRGGACGIVVPANLLAVDCDLLERSLGDSVWQIMLQVLGPPPMVRVGQSPKWMAFYGVVPGIRSSKRPGLEVFCGSGQIAAFGVHHKTGQPYRWSERSPLNAGPEALLPRVSPQMHDQFITRAARAGVLPGMPRRTTTATTMNRAGGYAWSGVAQRLNELCNESAGLIRPGTRKLIAELAAAGTGRHNGLVTICGRLVQMRWSDEQVLGFVAPLANRYFSERPGDDWSQEVIDALDHARNRDTARWPKPGGSTGAQGSV